jgi:hypothetical protein
MHKLRALLATFVLLAGLGLVAAQPASAHSTSEAGMQAICNNTATYYLYSQVVYSGYTWDIGWHSSGDGQLWFCSVLFSTGTRHGVPNLMTVSIYDNDGINAGAPGYDSGNFSHYAGPVKVKGCDVTAYASATGLSLKTIRHAASTPCTG